MGEEYNGELYFSSADVRPTKTALDGYQRIRTVGKGEAENILKCHNNIICVSLYKIYSNSDNIDRI